MRYSGVTIRWSAPAAGCAPTSYQLEAGSAAGLSNLATVNTGTIDTSFVATSVGVGTYFLRVRTITSSGLSAASNEVSATVGTTVAVSFAGGYDTDASDGGSPGKIRYPRPALFPSGMRIT